MYWIVITALLVLVGYGIDSAYARGSGNRKTLNVRTGFILVILALCALPWFVSVGLIVFGVMGLLVWGV
jgi:4-hydroxybenzoate polyprenyltransferase